MTALVEYLVRLRIAEPDASPVAGESGEAIAGLLIFEQTLWEAVPRFLRSLDAALTRAFPRNSEIDVSINYADYYYIEALLRVRPLAEN